MDTGTPHVRTCDRDTVCVADTPTVTTRVDGVGAWTKDGTVGYVDTISGHIEFLDPDTVSVTNTPT